MRFRGERFGLLLIAASLLVIAAICSLHVESQIVARRDQNRSESVGLARVLSSMPYAVLVPDSGRQGPLDLVKASQSNPDFAYSAVVDLAGRPLAQALAPGVILPVVSLPEEPAAWIGERVVSSSQGKPIRESLSPVIEAGQRIGHLRVGFFEPGYEILLEQASFFGLLALPVFLLAPLAYFMIRRGMRPLEVACAELNGLVQGQRLDTMHIEATGEVGEFIRGFNRFMALAKARVDELEKQRTSIVASSKILSYQKGRIEAVLETLPEATLVLDETGSVIFANAKLEALLGVSPEVAAGRKPREWCAHPQVLSILESSVPSSPYGAVVEPVEIHVGSSSERILSVATHGLASLGGSSQAGGAVVVMRDVTSESLARRAQGEFVTHVAHELKSPLNVMAMYGESLVGQEGDSEQFRVEASNVIRDEVERLGTLISTLLSIARIESGALTIARERVRLQDFLEDAVGAVSRSARHMDLRFIVDVPRETSPIYVDKDLFRVAINNLLTNAIKYNRPNGQVSVSAEEAEALVFIHVRDSGIGIREEDLPHIFEKFYRSEDAEASKRGGHGLGLPLAREIVELHGGRIQAKTVPGEGSEFSIELRRRAKE